MKDKYIRQNERVEEFLLLFGIRHLPNPDRYVKLENGSGFIVSPKGIRMIAEFYYSMKRSTLKVRGADYYSPSILGKCIREIDKIIIELRVKDLQHFKDSSMGLWCTDKEPKDKTDFFQLE